MSLLLPLDLTDNERPDVALVVELVESGAYIGQTILTMEMAYNNVSSNLSRYHRSPGLVPAISKRRYRE